MIKLFARSIAVAAAIIFVVSIEGFAQTNTFVAEVPFEFYVRGEKLPAGRYIFEPANRAVFPSPIVVRIADSKAAGAAIAPAIGADLNSINAKSGVMFSRHGDLYFFSGIVSSDAGYAVRIPLGREDRTVASRAGSWEPVVVGFAKGKKAN